MCARAPVRRAASITAEIATCSATRGREARKSAYSRLCGCGAASISDASSACTMSIDRASASTAIARSISSAVTGGNSSTPDSTRKHLNPNTPSATSGSRSSSLPGTRPPQKPTSTQTAPRAAARFASSAATEVVGGMLLSGMSTMVVTPPAAAARVAVANPSHSVRPGSLTCTWVSTSPGISTSSSASRTVRTAGSPEPSGAIRTMTPPRTPTSAGMNSPSTSTRSPATTRSWGPDAAGSPACGIRSLTPIGSRPARCSDR